MDALLPYVKTLLLLVLTGLSLFRMAPRAIREVHSWTDRILLSLLTGIAFYTIFFLVVQGLFHIPLTQGTLWGTFGLIVAAGAGLEIKRRREHRDTGFEPGLAAAGPETGRPKTAQAVLREVLVLAVLAVIFFFSLHIRIQNQLQFPDKLLDADPYRHHIRTENLLDTGYLSKFDPYLVGEVPIFELQGCYILTGVLGSAGPFTSHQLWLWGSQVFGALSMLSLYLFTKLGLRTLLQEDIGSSGKKKKEGAGPSPDTVATFLGLMAAAFWGASPVHILRTNAGFSEAYAIPMLAPALLFYLWAAQSRVWGDFVWFGVFFTALAFINPVPAVFIVPFLAVHALFVFLQTRDKRWIYGILISGAIFALCLFVWNWKFLATPLLTGAQATSHAGTEGILKAMGKNPTFVDKIRAGWNTFFKEIFRNLGFFNLGKPISQHLFGWFGGLSQRVFDFVAIFGAFLGSLLVLWDPKAKKFRWGVSASFFFLSYAVFFLILFLIPFGFVSFTSKYYRYLLPISMSQSVLFAYLLWRCIAWAAAKERMRVVLLSLATLIAVAVNVEGRTWGGWILNCTPEEYAAADWINKNTRPEDFIIANWYTADYLRSLTKRRMIISDYPRVEVRVAKERYNLDIPILPRDPAKVVEYAQQNPGTYYLVVSKWGPWGAYEKNPNFELLATFGKNPKTVGKVFKIETAPSSEAPAPGTN